MKRLSLLLLVIGCADGSVSTRSGISDLRYELDAGRVALAFASGNGSSSGAAIEAELVANTASSIRVSVNLARPVYLVNNGTGQNMVALQLFMRDGAYSSRGDTSFITLAPRSRTGVFFVAFCMDFHKDNPTARDRFAIGDTPRELMPLLRRIGDYLAANPGEASIAAAQAAIWLAQGVGMRDIKARFDMTPADEQLARRFVF